MLNKYLLKHKQVLVKLPNQRIYSIVNQEFRGTFEQKYEII